METYLGASDEDNVSDDVALADFIKECGPRKLSRDEIYDILMECL